MVAFIDADTELLRDLKGLLTDNRQRIEYKSSAAIIAHQEASDRLLRYEAHLSGEFDRTLSQLERLQRMRRGQRVLPPIKVEVSS